MKELSKVARLLLLPGMLGATRLPAAPSGPGTTPTLAILPLKEEGTKDLGDVADTMNSLVATAFSDSGAFQLVAPGRVLAALPASKLPADGPVELGRRLGAKFILTGSYLPERNPVDHSVSVTLTLRVVDTADGTVSRGFQETGAGPTLGSVVATLTHRLAAKAASANANANAAEGSPGAAGSAPAAIPVPAAIQTAAIQTPAPSSIPVVVPEPVPASAPNPKAARLLMVLREGKVNDIYFPNGGLPHYGGQIGEFEFLLHALAKQFPPEVSTEFVIGPQRPADDAALYKDLVRSHKPDNLVVLTVDCRTRSQSRLIFLNKSLFQVVVRVDYLTTDSLRVIASKSFRTDYIPAKGLGPSLPSDLRDQLVRGLVAGFPEPAPR